MPPYTNLKKLSDKHGEVEFSAEIPAETLEHYVLEELTHYAAELALPGFRKGKVPAELAREHAGEMELLESAADEALLDAMRDIVDNETLDVLGRPELTVLKIAPKNPLEFKIRFAVAPEVSLPDYKKIARTVAERKKDLTVKDEEIDQAIARIQEMTGIGAPAKKEDGTDKDGGGENVKPAPLTDEDVRKFGPFENVAAFRAELARNLAQEKEMIAKDGTRNETVKEIVAHAKVKVPAMLIEQEFRVFTEDRDRRIADAGLSMEEYLKRTKKTAEELEKEERALIEEDIKTSLVIREIKEKESLEPSEREIQIGVAHLKLRHPERDEASLRRSAEAQAIQEKLFAMLEGGDRKSEDGKDGENGKQDKREIPTKEGV